MCAFSSLYAYNVSIHLPWRCNIASSLKITFSVKLSSSKCCCILVQNGKWWALSSWVRACSNCFLYGFTGRCLWRIHHRIGCGIPSSVSSLNWGCIEKAPLHVSLSPVKSLVVLGILWCTDSHHAGIFHAIGWCCSSPAGPFQTWSENFAAQPQLTVFVHTEAAKNFSAPVTIIFIQPAPLAATDETKRLWHVHINLESFFFYMWVTCWILYAIQV
jgi:hypothetical protein